ncbi:MAG: hypothetical protein P1U88_15645 [Thalassobaculaceae bacterium]|nr:hypothetical protein [Thalassobaculaceae bacterium]
MRRIAVLIGLIAGCGVAGVAMADSSAPRHSLSDGTPLKQIVPPKGGASPSAPVTAVPPQGAAKKPADRRSRQPTQPPRIQPNARPQAPAPIEMKEPFKRPEKPVAPIGTIDTRPGTIHPSPGTIDAK